MVFLSSFYPILSLSTLYTHKRILTIAKSRVVLECLKLARESVNITVDVIQGGPDEPGFPLFSDRLSPLPLKIGRIC